ncbi:MAG: HNH endonuclease [Acidimicrobiia bacterium]|nr:HNH endonuclease [Acidimicrobiia bacterium]
MGSIAELDDVVEAMDLLAKVDWASVSGDLVGAALGDMSVLRAELGSIEAAATGAFDRSKAWMNGGSKAPGAWLAHRTRRAEGDHDRHRQRSRDLDKMPAVTEAFGAGQVSDRHVDALGWARACRPDHFADAEAFLVDKAKALRWRSFRNALRHWMDTVDRDATDRERRNRADTRYLHSSKSLDGMGRIDGWLEPIAFGAFDKALERITDELFEADWADAVAIHGDQTNVTHLARTPAQRRADALGEMAHRAMTAPKDGKRPLPLVNLVSDWDTFRYELDRFDGLDPEAPVDGQCRLLDGTPIPSADMFHQALLGHVRRVVFGGDGVAIDMGRKQRFFTGAVRDAILVTHQTCSHPTCDVPVTRCEIDHDIEWQDGGRTDQRNGKPYCWHHHHRWKQRHGP